MTEKYLVESFLQYLASMGAVSENGHPKDNASLPSLAELSAEKGISIAKLREQVGVARALGLVEVRPRTGIRRLPYRFLPAVRQSVGYAISVDKKYIDLFSDLRNHVEAAYFHQAVRELLPEDIQHLHTLIQRAWEKLRGDPIEIPHEEHRALHLAIYRRLANPFVQGLLEAYWEMYEVAGLNLYTGYDYLQQVWQYHQRMVDALANGDIEQAFTALNEHTDLIHHRPGLASLQNSETPSQTASSNS